SAADPAGTHHEYAQQQSRGYQRQYERHDLPPTHPPAHTPQQRKETAGQAEEHRGERVRKETDDPEEAEQNQIESPSFFEPADRERHSTEEDDHPGDKRHEAPKEVCFDDEDKRAECHPAVASELADENERRQRHSPQMDQHRESKTEVVAE